MRIIAGERARMPLVAPRDRTTRPITDRVKESLFSILQNHITDAYVADLFCGTGSLGLEALSRGAAHAIMLETDRDALKRLRQNIEKADFADRVSVFGADAFRHPIPLGPSWFGKAPRSVATTPRTLVFVDPPYPLSRDTSIDSALGGLLGILAEQLPAGAIVVVRHEKRSELLDEYAGLVVYDRRSYGPMALTFLEQPRGSEV